MNLKKKICTFAVIGTLAFGLVGCNTSSSNEEFEDRLFDFECEYESGNINTAEAILSELKEKYPKKTSEIKIAEAEMKDYLADHPEKAQDSESYSDDEDVSEETEEYSDNKTPQTNTPITTNSDLKTFKSEWGYSIKYPSKYTPTSLSSAVDFVITYSSGSNINIYTMDNVEGYSETTQTEFENQMAAQGIYITTTSYQHKSINGIDTITTTYKLAGNDVLQIMYFTDNYIYYVTYTKFPNTSSEVDKEMTTTAQSLIVD